MNNRFAIIVPFYNCAEYIKKNIESVKKQNYKNFVCYLTDDCSTDNSYQLALDAIGKDPRFALYRNGERKGAMANHIVMKKNISGMETIIVDLDGDDRLYDGTVLEFLNQVYQDINVWLTYGDYVTTTGNPSQNGPVGDTRAYRAAATWCTTHLRTYKNKIWKRIDDRDFRDETGSYFKIDCDSAIMYPLIEMCGKGRIRYIRHPLLVYNDTSPLNDFKVNLPLLERTHAYIKNKPLYGEI